MRIFKAIVIVIFAVFMMLGCFDFDVNAIWEVATDNPFLFTLGVIGWGLVGFVAANKFNTSDY